MVFHVNVVLVLKYPEATFLIVTWNHPTRSFVDVLQDTKAHVVNNVSKVISVEMTNVYQLEMKGVHQDILEDPLLESTANLALVPRHLQTSLLNVLWIKIWRLYVNVLLDIMDVIVNNVLLDLSAIDQDHPAYPQTNVTIHLEVFSQCQILPQASVSASQDFLAAIALKKALWHKIVVKMSSSRQSHNYLNA